MAKIKHRDKEIDVEKGTKAIDVLDVLGIVHGCQSGNCGKCIVEVKSGMENLGTTNESEDAFGLFENERLLCQCEINGDAEVFQEQ